MNNKNNSIPEIVFANPKKNKNLSLIFIILGIVLVPFISINIPKDEIAEYLQSISQLGINITLAISAIVISIFQFDKNFFNSANSKENQQKLVKSYIFKLFTIITISLVSYLVGILYKINYLDNIPILYIRVWITISGWAIFDVISKGLSTLVTFLNIK